MIPTLIPALHGYGWGRDIWEQDDPWHIVSPISDSGVVLSTGLHKSLCDIVGVFFPVFGDPECEEAACEKCLELFGKEDEE